MGRRDAGEEDVRRLQVTGEDGESYFVTLPKEYIRKLGWRKGRKVIIMLEDDRLVIEDWKEVEPT